MEHFIILKPVKICPASQRRFFFSFYVGTVLPPFYNTIHHNVVKTKESCTLQRKAEQFIVHKSLCTVNIKKKTTEEKPRLHTADSHKISTVASGERVHVKSNKFDKLIYILLELAVLARFNMNAPHIYESTFWLKTSPFQHKSVCRILRHLDDTTRAVRRHVFFFCCLIMRGQKKHLLYWHWVKFFPSYYADQKMSPQPPST